MKRNLCFISSLFLVIFFTYAQENKEDSFEFLNRKGQLFFNLGTELRITPLPYSFNKPLDSGARFTNIDLLHSGPALSYGLEYFINQNFSIGFNHSFRYDTVLYNFGGIEQNFGVENSQKELLQGLHLHINKYFRISKNSEIFIRLGVSSYNGGSQYLLKEPISFDENGNPDFFVDSQSDFFNVGLNLAVGYQNKRVKLLLGVYFSNGGKFFEEDFSIVTPYVKFTYTIGRLWYLNWKYNLGKVQKTDIVYPR